NVLPQVRQTFDANEIRILAEDIASTGIIQPPILAIFDEAHMNDYLALNNGITHSQVTKEELISFKYRNAIRYLLVLGGERRYRAMKHLWETGCEACQAKHPGSLRPG